MTIRIKGKTLFVAMVGIGMAATTYFTAKNTPEAQKRKELALEEKKQLTGDENAKLTWIESIKAQFGAYIPTIVMWMVTLGGIVGSEVFNEQALQRVEEKREDIKKMIEKLDGKGAVQVVEQAVELKKLGEKNNKPWEEKEKFRITFKGRTIDFESTRLKVMETLYEINRYFHLSGRVMFEEFLQYFNLKSVPEWDHFGWDVGIGESDYGYSWIDVRLKECEDESGVTELYMVVDPHDFDEDKKEDDLNDE